MNQSQCYFGHPTPSPFSHLWKVRYRVTNHSGLPGTVPVVVPMDAKLYFKRNEMHRRITKKSFTIKGQEVEWQEARSRATNELHPGIFPEELLRMSQSC